MGTRKRCEHPTCTCPPQEDDRFCSDSCREANQTARGNAAVKVSCKCGHADCAGDRQIHTQPEGTAPKPTVQM